jgi:hypothetical protein
MTAKCSIRVMRRSISANDPIIGVASYGGKSSECSSSGHISTTVRSTIWDNSLLSIGSQTLNKNTRLLQDLRRLAVGLFPVGKEHEPGSANDDIEDWSGNRRS